MMQTVTDTTPAAYANAAESAVTHLDLVAAGELLRVRGYELVCRFGHVHAAIVDAQEWHICLVADLASLQPARFLICLEESITQSVQMIAVR